MSAGHRHSLKKEQLSADGYNSEIGSNNDGLEPP